MTTLSADAAGSFEIGGDLRVTRLGYGTMQLTGPGVWGEPRDPAAAVAVLRRAVELGVTFFDTADSYGPYVAEPLLHRALAPYSDEIVIATKAGFTRQGPNQWTPVGRPAYLRQQTEMSLRILGVERIDLQQLHRIDPDVPIEDQIGELKAMQDEGKIRHIGLSEVSVEEVEAASKVARIASVQNLFNLSRRTAEPLLDYATANGIAFIPWFPLATGKLAAAGGPLAQLAAKHSATPSQLALAWLLRRSPAMLPIPGTSSIQHLEENIGATGIELSDEEFAELSQSV
ncbi:pyridoxine 4-dehydrogenase [Conyzicola nivalis]|uniref:Pyridoxine 4-dehydrogenase n=1 Tax=Conyzicola nivalis TaxID=1477021 RepID=A0ABV2QKR3_9MICO